ncbi:MAG TPA: patatin-like phospholipase family protein [Rhizomicrobium sp.]|nr:patatin-like phospholipase family protein [Rhizomicrobium sp.]
MTRQRKGPPFACVALTLQGGGALGAYQAGVYQALAEAELHPDWVAGISIGSINAAIIAGNPPGARVERLRGFWDVVTSTPGFDAFSLLGRDLLTGDAGRRFVDQMSAATAVMVGVSGFFRPRLLPPFLERSASPGATSFYDTGPLAATLERFVDFDRINARETRLSVGAVNVESGNFVYFDSTTHRIGPEHIMASGALPPGFPAIEIDGQHYWDGGLVSNSPLQWVLQYGPRQDTLAFEVDLWSARGRFPRDVMEVATREKEIRYSSRTRDNVDRFADTQRLRHAVAKLLDLLPEDTRRRPEAVALETFADDKVYNIIHLIYRSKIWEGESKDYEFSTLGMRDHWNAGYRDTVATLRHPEVLERPKNSDGIAIFDCATPDPGK